MDAFNCYWRFLLASSPNRGARIASPEGIVLNQSTFTEMRIELCNRSGEKEKEQAREVKRKERNSERECPMCVPSNYNGLQQESFVCALLPQKHCCTAKCPTTNDHRCIQIHHFVLFRNARTGVSNTLCGRLSRFYLLIHSCTRESHAVCGQQTSHLSLSRGIN